MSNPKESVNGVLLVNKPLGLSSNLVLQKVKRLYNAKKAGHTGSLDPLATGMLPICFGEATKFCQYLLDSEKTYRATGLLGIKTATGDAEGEVLVVNKLEQAVSEKELLLVLQDFIGQTMQIPSMFSALKHKGIPLYKYARNGENIERPARPITIKSLELQRFDGRYFDVIVTCSKGTYIRNLIDDIGERLGVGAHVSQLHRVNVHSYAGHAMFSLDELTEQSKEQRLLSLLPIESAVSYLPMINVDEQNITNLRQGKTVNLAKQPHNPGCFRLHDEQGRFTGLVQWQQTGELRVQRLLQTRSSNFM